MSEYKKPTTAEEFAENFAPVSPLMNETQAYYESSRCLFCYDAPCINACPTEIDIPLFIRQIHTGNTIGAAKTIYASNVFGHACGKVCPTEVLCEGACVYNHQEVKPIEIGRLQSFATHQAMTEGKQLFRLAESNGKKVAVIGAGPAGISVACELRMLGCEVDIFEAKAHPSGLTVYGVAPYKITNEEALQEMAYLQDQFGFRVHYNHRIETKEQLKALEADYDAIFLGIGLGKTRSIMIEGDDLPNCYGAVEFIEQLRMDQEKVKIGRRVIVLGGGNTAMDAASEAARLGAEEVKIAYRRGKEQMSAYEFEYDLAKGAGAKGLFHASPIKIVGDEKVEGVLFDLTEMVDGQLKVIPECEFVEPCDMVIFATGQEKQVGFLSLIDGLDVDAKGRIKVNEQFQTTKAKYFAAGDAVNGGAEVVNAVAEGKKAANGMFLMMTNN